MRLFVPANIYERSTIVQLELQDAHIKYDAYLSLHIHSYTIEVGAVFCMYPEDSKFSANVKPVLGQFKI